MIPGLKTNRTDLRRLTHVTHAGRRRSRRGRKTEGRPTPITRTSMTKYSCRSSSVPSCWAAMVCARTCRRQPCASRTLQMLKKGV